MKNDVEGLYFVPKSRLNREWRKWVRKIKAGDDVFVTRCGKEPRGVMLVNNEEWEWLMREIERPPRPLSEVMQRAIAHHPDLLTTSAPREEKDV